MKEWYRQSHTNPKTQTFSAAEKQSVDAYSKLIRKGLTDTMLKEN
ncbi:hypothetical protein [Psychrobacter arenosus]|nr:hypothetical protein [Psychrobacter arenosus]